VNEPLSLRTACEWSELTERLTSAGLGASEAGNKAELFATCARALHNCGLEPQSTVRAFFVPGRIEVLGKHTDYAGGRSILSAAEKGFCIVATQREDAVLRIVSVDRSEQEKFSIGSRLRTRSGHWCNYPLTVGRRLARNFPGPLRGADVAFASDLPASAGMGSSSAMIVSFFLVLSAFNDLASRKKYRRNIGGLEDLATYLSTIENGQSFGTLAGDKGVGTLGGSEDHTAILCCQAGSLSQYAYCPVRLERTLELPSDHVFAIASSGVAAEKSGAARAQYNRASELCRCALEKWNKVTGRTDPHLAAAITSDLNAPGRLRNVLEKADDEQFSSRELIKRFEHFLCESEQIVPAAGEALGTGNLAEFSRQVLRSQEQAEGLLGNQVPETIFLVRRARELGAVASSAFGAGFGGSVWALTKVKRAKGFLAEWSASYTNRFPHVARDASFFLTGPGPAAFEF
jgi:galactokinase